MPASHICSWKSSCFWFAGFCEWHVEIGSSSVFTDAVMYCVPQGWKSVSQIFDWSCLHQAKVSHAEEKNSVMFDSPTPSCTGIHTYPGKSSLAQHSWLAHGDKCLRDLWVYWLLWGNDRFVCCMVRVKRCQSVLRGLWDEVGYTAVLYLTAFLGEPAASGAPAAEAETSECAAAAMDSAPCFELDPECTCPQTSQPIHVVLLFSSNCWNKRQLKTINRLR